MIQRSSIGGEDGGMRAFECIIRSGGGMGVVCWPTLWLFDCLSLLVTDFCIALQLYCCTSTSTGTCTLRTGQGMQQVWREATGTDTVLEGSTGTRRSTRLPLYSTTGTGTCYQHSLFGGSFYFAEHVSD